jgi:hypothetical protein
MQSLEHFLIFTYSKTSKDIPPTLKKRIKLCGLLISVTDVVDQDFSTNTKLDDSGLLRTKVEIIKFGVLDVETNYLLLGNIKHSFNLRIHTATLEAMFMYRTFILVLSWMGMVDSLEKGAIGVGGDGMKSDMMRGEKIEKNLETN